MSFQNIVASVTPENIEKLNYRESHQKTLLQSTSNLKFKQIGQTFGYFVIQMQMGRVGGVREGGCERRTEVFVKIQNKKLFFWGGGLGWGGGGQGGCESRIEFFWKIQNSKKKNWGGGGRGVRMDVNEELKFL